MKLTELGIVNYNPKGHRYFIFDTGYKKAYEYMLEVHGRIYVGKGVCMFINYSYKILFNDDMSKELRNALSSISNEKIFSRPSIKYVSWYYNSPDEYLSVRSGLCNYINKYADRDTSCWSGMVENIDSLIIRRNDILKFTKDCIIPHETYRL